MMDVVGVICGKCGGTIYMETCEIEDHEWVTASECQRCGARHVIESGCLSCSGDGANPTSKDQP